MAQPEKLSLWDRWFNRRRRVIHARGSETWSKRYVDTIYEGQKIPKSEYSRDWIDYLETDRVTGSEKIVRKYLN